MKSAASFHSVRTPPKTASPVVREAQRDWVKHRDEGAKLNMSILADKRPGKNCLTTLQRNQGASPTVSLWPSLFD
jgi:hypothetical protein